MRSQRWIVAAVVAALCTFSGFANQAPADNKPGSALPKPPDATTPAPDKPSNAKTSLKIKVYSGKDDHTVKNEVRLGDEILFEGLSVENARDLTLFLDGRDTKLKPTAITEEGVRFRLKRTTDNKEVWSDLLHQPLKVEQRLVHASVGKGAPGNFEPAKFWLVVARMEGYGWWWLFFLLAVIAAVIGLAWKSDLLRDGPASDNGDVKQPYSLGRSQMAFWFILILCGYVFIWVIAGDRDSMTDSLLILMGISASTAVGAALINSTDEATRSEERKRLTAEEIALNAAITAKRAEAANKQATDASRMVLDTDAAAAEVRVDVIQKRLREISNRPKSTSWIRDILSDASGKVMLHRLQIAVWTLVLGIIFVVYVVTSLTMVEFNPTLLALMGISAGTYLGFKFPER